MEAATLICESEELPAVLLDTQENAFHVTNNGEAEVKPHTHHCVSTTAATHRTDQSHD